MVSIGLGAGCGQCEAEGSQMQRPVNLEGGASRATIGKRRVSAFFSVGYGSYVLYTADALTRAIALSCQWE
jgi:hypothetical protein